MRRVVTALLLALVALALAAPGALAQNDATAINTEDDSSLFELAFQIKEVTGEVVDQTNVAQAYSNCERCQTVAIAIQVVLVMSESPGTVTPTNLAVAVNEECSSCQTMALAYQLVVGTGGPVELTERGEAKIRRIRSKLAKLEKSGLTLAEIDARTAELVDELRAVLETELVPRREDDDDDDDDRDNDRDRDEDRFRDGEDEDRDGSGDREPDVTTPVEPPETEAQPTPEPQPEQGQDAPTTTAP